MQTIFFFLIFSISQVLWASEKLGALQVQDILLRPYLLVQEPQSAEFQLGESSVAFSWAKSKKLGALVRVGGMSLISPFGYVDNSTYTGLGFYEAYGQFTTDFGRWRMGLIPIEFGVEGRTSESEMIFPRTLFFRNGAMTFRDVGLQYQVGHRGFYTSMTVHNGEVTSNSDGRMFFTARWGWRNKKNFDLGLSAQTGTTKPMAMTTPSQLVAAVDTSLEAKWRLANFYVNWTPNQWFFTLEAFTGELEQKGVEDTKYTGGHVDLGYQFSSALSVYARYDHFDPNEKLDADLLREASAAIKLSDHHDTNSLIFIVVKKYEQGPRVNNDEARLVWRMTPYLSH